MRLNDTMNDFEALNEGEKYPESSPFMSSNAPFIYFYFNGSCMYNTFTLVSKTMIGSGKQERIKSPRLMKELTVN